MFTTDLHNHTFFSYDGSNSPDEIIENAIVHGIDVIGITDHQFSIGDRIGEYFETIQRCKIKYQNQIKVLCGLEIGTRPQPQDLLADATEQFDYVLFECLDSDTAMDFYEFLEWQKLLRCKKGLAHTDIFRLSARYGVDGLAILRENNIFWELNTSGNYPYYYDFLTNINKRESIRQSGISVSVGSDTHRVEEYRYKQIRRANELLQKLGNPMIF